MNFSSIFQNVFKFFKNITLFQALLIVSALYICFAATDVITKTLQLKKYDIERLLADIQSKYPNSELKVQNIKVVDNFMKRGSARTTYYIYDSNYFYIKDNQFCKEPSYFWLLFFVPPLIVLTIFNDPRNLKLKDINTVSDMARFSAFGVFFLFLIVMGFFFWMGDDREYVTGGYGNFNYSSQEFMSNIDLSKYLKSVEE